MMLSIGSNLKCLSIWYLVGIYCLFDDYGYYWVCGELKKEEKRRKMNGWWVYDVYIDEIIENWLFIYDAANWQQFKVFIYLVFWLVLIVWFIISPNGDNGKI